MNCTGGSCCNDIETSISSKTYSQPTEEHCTGGTEDTCGGCCDSDKGDAPLTKPVKGQVYQKGKISPHTWKKIIVLLAWVSIIWSIAEGVSSLVIGIKNKQLDLVAYGGQSIVEVLTAIIVLRRIRVEAGYKEINATDLIYQERIGVRAIGFLYTILVILVVGGSLSRFLSRTGPETTVPGLILSSICLGGMYLFAVLKTNGAKVLNSGTVMADANCSMFCAKIAAVVMIGSFVGMFQPQISEVCTSRFCNFWWLDPFLALVISGFIFRDGTTAIYNSYQKILPVVVAAVVVHFKLRRRRTMEVVPKQTP